ncbi:hypothetical protein H4582DRAFT_535199 [Lactarius indigo]|nr:hypothetical protein H4582DRAFT_535199 [Lactarius indigo]
MIPGYPRGSSSTRAMRSARRRRLQQPNYISPRPAQPAVTSYYDPQPPTQDGFRNITPVQFGRGNEAYWENPANSFNYNTTGSFGIGAPPPWNGGEYPLPQVQYGHFGQGGINHTGFPFVAEPLSSFATNPSHPFPGTSAAPEQPRSVPSLESFRLRGCL